MSDEAGRYVMVAILVLAAVGAGWILGMLFSLAMGWL